MPDRLTISDLQQIRELLSDSGVYWASRPTIPMSKSPIGKTELLHKVERVLEDLSVLSLETEITIRPIIGNLLQGGE